MQPMRDVPLDVLVLKRTTSRVAGELRIYSRDSDTRVRFIADGSPIADAERLVLTEFLEDDAQAADVAAACAGYLNSQAAMRADRDGWHQLPSGGDIGVVLSNLLRVARKAASIAPGRRAAPIEPPFQGQPSIIVSHELSTSGSGRTAAAKRDGRTKWARKHAEKIRLVILAERGYSTKKIAALIGITPNNVSARARRLGVPIGEERGRVSTSLAPGVVHVFDRAAASMGLEREDYIARLLTYDARHPARLQVVAG